MTFKIKIASVAAVAAVVAMTLAGCSAGATSSSTTGAAAVKGNKICVYTHGDGGTFWSVFQKGAEAAAADLNVTLDYQGSTNDSAKQAQTITAGIAAGCQGIAASAPDPAAIKTAMLAAHAAGIPTVTANSGSAVFAELGAFTHIGQDEIVAGRAAGEKFNAMGLKNILCPIQEAANSGLTERCKGASETFKGKVTNFNVDGALADLTGAEAKIAAALTADPTIDGIFALNADVATGAALPAATASGRAIKIGTIDMSADALKAIKAGTIAFAVDQQQYAQGYMAVVLLNLAINNGNELGGGLPIYSGPGFVTAENVDAVMALVAAGTR
ncbi:sugar ABC transporter substrate-binding protein [Alpinimonas psychrophila]|uniref:Simple sugar transport system substrate-binding protein n=1 Tax=Alpinimonas psychrophila TaxID=748908 RepID=A0A7W3PN86_9MICO|nr:substrate-binding domain-containing protein [Alpinimonas psychrophila]MBA8828135.1 simple sugar transport system substrate-binding protein [Alpinimonas psychrophila]